MRPKAAKYYKLQHSLVERLILYQLLLPIEIHLTLCGLQAKHRSTLASLLLQSCLIVVSLLARCAWNSGTASSDVTCSKAIFENTYSKGPIVL